VTRIARVLTLTALAAGTVPAQAQVVQTPDSQMAPIHEYLIADRQAEIELARSAAAESISRRAEVMVLGRNGYEVAVRGTNHFVCLVERSWDGAPQFWNPRIRGPDCLNAAAARFYLPIVRMRTRLALAGKSQAQIEEALEVAFKQKRLAPPGAGAMSYMMSKRQYLNDQAGNWHPHVMFFVPLAMASAWGANLPGSPILSNDDAPDRLTIFMIPLARWSDGTPDAAAGP
jgi:hypothetical protein